MTHEFILPSTTLSQNQLDGKHWSVKHQQKKYWHDAVGYIARKGPSNGLKASVHIIRVSKRLLDPLNVPAGCKWLLDAFVKMGWLKDDSYKWCTVLVSQRKCNKGEEEHMEVLITYHG